MSSFKRKMRRKKEKDAEKELSEKVGLFDKLPNECSACSKPFDKKDKAMVTSWSVVVREEEGVVRLYCPECWKMATSVVEQYKKENNK